MDYITLSYLYSTLENKVNYRYNIRLQELNSIYIYNFESVAKAIKQNYTNYINFMVKNKVKYKYCT